MAEMLAQKMEWLLLHIPDPESGNLYTTTDLAAAIRRARPDAHVTEEMVTAVCDGSHTHPSTAFIEGLAHAFGVSSTFLVSEDATIRDLQAQLDLLELLKAIVAEAHATGAQGPLRIGCIR